MAVIETANEIIDEYSRMGFDLTLRQLYYQFVSRDLIPNKQSEYKSLGKIIKDARLAGLIDWNAIVDRTRNLRQNPHWDNPAEILHDCARSYATDKWETQKHRLEVWIEKDALVGVISDTCTRLDVPYFSCRGYSSLSEMWRAAQRLLGYVECDQDPIVIQLGDHDPSGLDMTRDIEDRLALLTRSAIPVVRAALNMDQVKQYNPPPNPAKITDSRATDYIKQYGTSSWELDALRPDVLAGIVRDAVEARLDREAWDRAVAEEREERGALYEVAREWEDES